MPGASGAVLRRRRAECIYGYTEDTAARGKKERKEGRKERMGSKQGALGAVLIGRSYRFSVLHFGQFCRHASLSSVDYRSGNICNDNLSGIFIPSCFRQFSRWKNAKRIIRICYAACTRFFLPSCVSLQLIQNLFCQFFGILPIFFSSASYFLKFNFLQRIFFF